MDGAVSRPCLSGYWSGRANCSACQAPTIMPLQAVPRYLGNRAMLEAEAYSLPAGAPLCNAGEPAHSVFSIRRGFIKLWRTDCAGKCRIVRLLGPGDMVGLEALLQPAYGLSATAITPCQLCMIPRSLLERLEHEHPAMYRDIERRWHAQLERTDTLLLDVLSGPARQRVLKFLAHMADIADPEPCPRVRRLDMAATLDIAPETAARVIAELKKTGVLTEAAYEMRFDREQLPLD